MNAYPSKNNGSDIDAMFSGAQVGASARVKSSPAAGSALKPGVDFPKVEKKTVLVVDDNKDYRELIHHLLSVNHYDVLEAGNGIEALSVINNLNPDLVLVDFNMPKMNGYELIQEVRSNIDTRKMRIIMFTGATNRQHLKSLNMDISDFLEKPVTNAKLLESISKAFGIQRIKPPQKQTPQFHTPKSSEIVEPEPTSISIERFESAPKTYAQKQSSPEAEPPLKDMAIAEEAIETPPVQVPPRSVEIEVPAQIQEEAQEVLVPETEEVSEIEEMIEEDDQELEILEDENGKKDAIETHGLEELTDNSPLIQRVNKILMAAVNIRASDIHIEPNEDRVIVRVRVDGVLKQLTTLPASIHARLTARIKIMSGLVITERRLPQDGQFRVQIKGQKIEFRVSTLPCIKGEKIVMRILGQSKLNSSLAQLDLSTHELKALETAIKSTTGLILVTGPTGSGKTTTLYTMINVLNRPDVNIMTAEDPVEYEVPNVNQVKILSGIGLTFESTLRAFLRQDPDVMLVGEIRDLETAEISIKASITGHLVFSTLHTNNAPATITRLTHMEVAPYLVAASVKLVIAQRLVRTLCPHCKRRGPVREEDKKFLTEKEIEHLKTVYYPGNCSRCNHGYSGRKAVFEIMPVDSSAMRQLITSSSTVDEINQLAITEGMVPLRQSALNAVQEGYTSLPEALKIIMG
ncbi:MAG: ATPase, T2SS/T4P/T4SS family [Elusimicrobiota bacterium]|nr:ATPase, T2SS/T4P/T4SS family [Elusimicrobiota bacterium]